VEGEEVEVVENLEKKVWEYEQLTEEDNQFISD
jgi:hypothetical protein